MSFNLLTVVEDARRLSHSRSFTSETPLPTCSRVEVKVTASSPFSHLSFGIHHLLVIMGHHSHMLTNLWQPQLQFRTLGDFRVWSSFLAYASLPSSKRTPSPHSPAFTHDVTRASCPHGGFHLSPNFCATPYPPINWIILILTPATCKKWICLIVQQNVIEHLLCVQQLKT